MLPQIVEQGAHVRAGCGENGQAITGTKLGHDEHPSLVLQDRGAERPSGGSSPQPGGVLQQGGGERRKRFGIERAAGRVLDRQAVPAEDQDGFDALMFVEASDHLVQAGHQSSVSGEQTPGTYESLSCKSSKKMLIPLPVTLNLLRSMRTFPLCFALLVAAACSDDNGLPDATLNNIERTDTLYALVGTPITTPSAYALDGSRRIRTDISVDFDFAYNVEPDGRHVFVPRAVLGINETVNPGFQLRTETFQGITEAPSNGYITDRVVPIAVGERYVARSRITCTTLGVPKYAKIEIVSFDDVTRIVTFRILTDDNCGFRGLEPGLPDD